MLDFSTFYDIVTINLLSVLLKICDRTTQSSTQLYRRPRRKILHIFHIFKNENLNENQKYLACIFIQPPTVFPLVKLLESSCV